MHIAVAIVAVTVFVYSIFCIIKGIIENDPILTFIGFTFSIALAVVTPLYLEANVSTESEIEENIETTMEYMTSSEAEDSTKTQNNLKITETEESSIRKIGIGSIALIMLVTLVVFCFPKKKKETNLERIVRETDENPDNCLKKTSISKQTDIEIKKLGKRILRFPIFFGL